MLFSRMPRPFRSLLVLTLIMTASCLDVTENDATTTTETSTSASGITTIAAEENASPSSSSSSPSDAVWECPNITKAGVECSCDFPHTLRCTGDRTTLQVIANDKINQVLLSKTILI